ncbi:MAG TPA: GNAT family N-acetyltransferase [Streptosporangiaceae bacterium]|nr:GNAT family N-acetyltransferase [Streptosporangiaceae bacterium]
MTIEYGRVAVTDVPVQRLSAADLAGCLALADDRGWPPEPDKWQLLFEVGEVSGIRDPAGGLAGAVALTRYGSDLAAIGMMLVAQRHGRRGLGRALMTHVLDQAGGVVTCLFATDFGRPLYERLGFRPAYRSDRYIGPLAPGPLAPGPLAPGPLAPGPAAAGGSVPVRPATPEDLPAIARLDRVAFGADRSGILARLPQLSERFLVAAGPDGRAVRGFAASAELSGLLLAGPVVADDLDVATALLTGLAADSGRPLRIEVASTHPGLARWAAGHGLTARSQAAFMTHGGVLPGRPGQVFGPLNVAMG